MTVFPGVFPPATVQLTMKYWNYSPGKNWMKWTEKAGV
jgi:hypothetical protein